MENTNLLGSPPRIRGYKTPAKEGSAIVIRSLASDAKASKNRWLQKKIEEKEQGDDWLSIVKERMPIDILVQICVANVIEEQTRLVNLTSYSHKELISPNRRIKQWYRYYWRNIN